MYNFNEISFYKYFESLTDEFFASVLKGYIFGKISYSEPYIYIMGYSGKASVIMHWFNDDPTSIYIASLNVDCFIRKQGIGNKLLELCENIGKHFGAINSFLLVDSEQWMHEWYERHGYKDYMDFVGDDMFDTGDDIQFWMKKSLK